MIATLGKKGYHRSLRMTAMLGKTGPTPLFGHTKTSHALFGMGSTALEAAVALPR